MTDQESGLIASALLLGLVFGIMLICYENGKPFGLFKRIRCGSGTHRHRVKIGKYKRAVYHCLDCKKPRKHPSLKVVQGGKIELGNFKF